MVNFLNGKQFFVGVDVIQYVKDNLWSLNNSVVEFVGLNVYGKSVGKVIIRVFNYLLGCIFGDVDVEVYNEDIRIYVLDVVIVIWVLGVFLKLLNSFLWYFLSLSMD